MNTILVTGGTGYIGSHTCIMLLEAGFKPIILDNLINSKKETIHQIAKITGIHPTFIEGDIRDINLLDKIFAQHPINAVLHFAALKSVAESVTQPLIYYDNNVTGTLNLLLAMRKAQVKSLVFSSSATVYGNIPSVPYQEQHPRIPINPYGQCKKVVEDILMDLQQSEPDWRIASLRYFNPIGAHPSGLIGENPHGTPNNLMPYLTQVAKHRLPKLNVFGGDYPTPDGTCIRDYIHVMDLAKGHLEALNYLFESTGFQAFNLGTGNPVSVLKMIETFSSTTGSQIPYQIVGRRAGDLPAYWADSTKAKKVLNWEAKMTLQQMCADTWRWENNHSKHAETLL